MATECTAQTVSDEPGQPITPVALRQRDPEPYLAGMRAVWTL